MKKLAVYLTGKDRDAFAKKCSVSKRTLQYWLAGTHVPNVVMAIHIERLSKGFVSVYDWA